MFSGGPPSPKKVVLWEIEFRKMQTSARSNGMQTQLKEIAESLKEWGGYKQKEEVEYTNNNRKIVEDTQMLMKFMSVEGLLILLGSYLQIRLLGSLLKENIII